MLKHEWVVHVVSFIQNMFIMACFTFIAVQFNKWWLILISVIFIALAKYDPEYRVKFVDKEEIESDEEE